MIYKLFTSGFIVWLPSYATIKDNTLLLEKRDTFFGLIPTFKNKENIQLNNIQSTQIKTKINLFSLLIGLFLIFSTLFTANLIELALVVILILAIVESSLRTELIIRKASTDTIIKVSMLSRKTLVTLHDDIESKLNY